MRDERGRFVKGGPGGPGRPKREREIEYYRIMESAVSPADWRAICQKAVEQAKRGDPVARKWLSDYLVGPPVERKEISGIDGGAIYIVAWDENAVSD